MIKKRNWLSASLAAAILMNLTASAVVAEGRGKHMFQELNSERFYQILQ